MKISSFNRILIDTLIFLFLIFSLYFSIKISEEIDIYIRYLKMIETNWQKYPLIGFTTDKSYNLTNNISNFLETKLETINECQIESEKNKIGNEDNKFNNDYNVSLLNYLGYNNSIYYYSEFNENDNVMSNMQNYKYLKLINNSILSETIGNNTSCGSLDTLNQTYYSKNCFINFINIGYYKDQKLTDNTSENLNSIIISDDIKFYYSNMKKNNNVIVDFNIKNTICEKHTENRYFIQKYEMRNETNIHDNNQLSYDPLKNFKIETTTYIGWKKSKECFNEEMLILFLKYIQNYQIKGDISNSISISISVFVTIFIFTFFFSLQIFKYELAHPFSYFAYFMNNLILVLIITNPALNIIEITYKNSYIYDSNNDFSKCSDEMNNGLILATLRYSDVILKVFSILYIVLNFNWLIPLALFIKTNVKNEDFEEKEIISNKND